MLVLTRREDESIMIGDDIEIKCLDIRESQVKLGIVAPKNVPVHRKEVFLAIQEENQEAAAAPSLEAVSKVFTSGFPHENTDRRERSE